MGLFFFVCFLKMGEIIADRNNPIKKKIDVEGEKLKRCHGADGRGWDPVQKQTQEHEHLI